MTAAPWATVTDLPAGLPGGEAGLDRACVTASEVLYGLSGRRWSGRASRTIEVFASGTPWWWSGPDRWDASWGACSAFPAFPVLVDGNVYNHAGCDAPQSIRLPDYPVESITSVTVGGEVRDPATYRLIGDRYLEDTWGGWVTCGGDRPMVVTYVHGTDPPAAGKAAAVRLATELAKAADGQGSALPGYISQRVRQGETITYVTAATLFDKGRTGIAEVDLWLATVNPSGLRRRSRVWSPDTDPHYRITDPGGTTP